MLLQVDGSHHAWLEERGPRFTLLLADDDATGDVPCALFRPAEDARGYFSLMRQIVQRRGPPLALYSDRHGVILAQAGRRAQRPATQFARAMQELGITQVFARSPQALDLDAVLAFCHARTVARDNTVKYPWRTLQLLPSPQRTSYAGARVDVIERPDGDLSVRHHGDPIATRLAPSPPAVCAPAAPNWPAIPITSRSSPVEVRAAPCSARPPMGQPMERHPTAPSTAARCDRPLRANSPAGRRSSRLSCKACRCGPPPACSGSRASP